MLENITDINCPECGSKMCGESRRNRHSNGYYNECREFECGAKIKWSPNFKAIVDGTKCPNSKEVKERKKNRSAALENISTYIFTLDLHKSDAEKIESAVFGCYFPD